MGQPVSVVEKPSPRPGIVRYEINRTLTGTGHEHYAAAEPVAGQRPCDELARRLFDRGGIEAIHMKSNMITVSQSPGGSSEGILEIIGDLHTHYRPGVPVPSPEDFATAD